MVYYDDSYMPLYNNFDYYYTEVITVRNVTYPEYTSPVEFT
jgi:hypothetical protein